jgi:hypothetical protein
MVDTFYDHDQQSERYDEISNEFYDMRETFNWLKTSVTLGFNGGHRFQPPPYRLGPYERCNGCNKRPSR